MIRYGFFLPILLISLNSFSQKIFDTEKKDTANVYHFALYKYCNYLDTRRDKPSTLYVEESPLVTDHLPGLIRNYRIHYLAGAPLKNLLIEKEEIMLLRISHLRVEEGSFFVEVTPFDVTCKKGSFHYDARKALRITFGFDPKINGLAFRSSEFVKI